MKKISMILVAFAMVLTMTQCKKNEETNPNETVTITLNVKGNNGAKVDVNPEMGTVDFESGDKVYVGSGGKYVGFLTHNGTSFVGNITNPMEGQPLQFYFLGNVTPNETLSAGTSEECSVIIRDQTEHLPVISCSPSFENYVSGVTAYTGHLLNKCALVKFSVTTPSNSPICITGMNNKVTIDFTQNTVTPSMDGEGIIKLPAGAGENVEKWAILLPQEAMEEGEEGSAYTENGAYIGTRGAIPTIGANGYLNNGIEVNVLSIVSMDHEYVDLGLPSGLLWATCNVGANAPEEYGDYFAWGETQPKDYYDWSTYQYCNGSENTLTKYCWYSGNGYNGYTDNLIILQPEDDAATVNWGAEWRTPTEEEWMELYQNTTSTKITQDGVLGWLFTASNNNSIFLPAGGIWVEGNLNFGGTGNYWSSSLSLGRPEYARSFNYNSYDYIGVGGSYRRSGQSIRPVRSAPQNNTPVGAINGLFTINANGDQVYFSQGNLQYQASTDTWQFATNQWDRVGADNANISQTYNGWIDLFGWGTSGYNHGANSYQPWSTSTEYSDYYAYGSNINNLYDQNRKADWGYNPILNGGNQENLWRTLTYQEWWYLLWERTTPSGYRFVKAIVDGVSGIIVLPDNWVSSIYSLNYPNVELNTGFGINTISASDWNSVLGTHGAVFLPVTGKRTNGTYVSSLSWGGYWASSVNEDRYAHCCVFEYAGLTPAASGFRNNGLSVRLVQDYNP
ncbi:MAG: hypothetical protein K6A94_05005 [Bacteroidales bacterium]|nr:hypothetical protein [Bacteroidales bacterium]